MVDAPGLFCDTKAKLGSKFENLITKYIIVILHNNSIICISS